MRNRAWEGRILFVRTCYARIPSLSDRDQNAVKCHPKATPFVAEGSQPIHTSPARASHDSSRSGGYFFFVPGAGGGGEAGAGFTSADAFCRSVIAVALNS